LSLGGWPDPVPAPVLRSMGCERIVLINRRGETRGFATDVAKLLGATEEDIARLYGLSEPSSGYVTAVLEQDATICTDWDSFNLTDISGLSNEGFTAPLLTEDPSILAEIVGSSNEKIEGCTPMDTGTASVDLSSSHRDSRFRIGKMVVAFLVYALM